MSSDFSILERAIEAADADTCVDFLINLTDAERKAAWLVVKKKLTEYQKTMRSTFSNDKMEQARMQKIIQSGHDVLPLAVLATGSIGDMKKLGEQSDPFGKPEQVLRLMKAVAIPWLGEWLEFLAQSGRPTTYEYLIARGYAPEPKSEGYITGLFYTIFWSDERINDLKDNRYFLDNWVWRLLEVEGVRSQSLAGVDSYADPNRTWSYVLKSFSDEGKLDRKRLLDSSLATLSKDFEQYHANWFSRFHEFMEPTLAERVDYESRYIHLLSSSVSSTVNFALAALKIIDKGGHLKCRTLDPFLHSLAGK